MKILISLAIVAISLVAPLGAAGAPKPSPSGSTIVVAPGSVLAFGGVVTFETTLPKLSAKVHPEVSVVCSQGGALVFLQVGAPDAAFTLGAFGSPWYSSGGPASCEADLFYYTWRGQVETGRVDLVSVSFDAAA